MLSEYDAIKTVFGIFRAVDFKPEKSVVLAKSLSGQTIASWLICSSDVLSGKQYWNFDYMPSGVNLVLLSPDGKKSTIKNFVISWGKFVLNDDV